MRVGRVDAVDLRALQECLAPRSRAPAGRRTCRWRRTARRGRRRRSRRGPSRGAGPLAAARTARRSGSSRSRSARGSAHGSSPGRPAGRARSSPSRASPCSRRGCGRCRAPAGRGRCSRPRRRPRIWIPRSTTSASWRATSARGFGGDAVFGVGGREGLAGELQQDPVVLGPCRAGSLIRSFRSPRRSARPAVSSTHLTPGRLSPSLYRTNRRTATFSPSLADASSSI